MPSPTAASEVATAHSVSLCTWIPSGVSGFSARLTVWMMAATSCGRDPPLVSQSTRQWAPAASAARSVRIA